MAEKGIKTIWIDSDSVGVLGTKVYRDDVLIATVPFGTLKYDDPTAEVGVEYKYVTQAYTATSESTDETLGVNMNYYTIIGDISLKPVLSGFRIEDAEPTRVYFDSLLGPVTGMTVQGFNISNYGEPDSVVIDLDGLGGYFTTARTHTYYNNEKIRLSDGDGTVYDFTYEYIENNIAKPTEGANNVFYVVNTVSSSGDGLSEDTAFKTLQEGITAATTGTKIWVKATGVNYTEGALNDGINGTATNPIVIEGYKNTIGDITSNYYTVVLNGTYNALDNSEMPLFDGGNRDANIFYDYASDDYYTWRNIQVQNYRYAFQGGNDSNGFIWDNIILKDLGTATNSGFGIRLNGNTTGATENRILNSIILNATGEAIRINGQKCLVNNVQAYCNEAIDSGDTATTTDYYFLIAGEDNIVINSLAYKDTPNGWGHNGHGFALKTNSATYPVQYNLVDNCEAVGVLGSFQFRHTNCRYNVIKNSEARADIPNRAPGPDRTGGIDLVSGGSFNIAENLYIHDVDTGVIWGAIGENDEDPNVQFNTTIRNVVFADLNQFSRCNITTGASARPYNNSIQNCTITDTPLLFKYISGDFIFGANTFTNNIFNGVTTKDSGWTSTGWVYEYSLSWDIWLANGTPISGTDNESINPDLNASYQPQADFNSISVPKIATINYDKDGNERQDPTTVGSVLSSSEI